MATVDIAVPREMTVGRALRGRRVDVPGLAFEHACSSACSRAWRSSSCSSARSSRTGSACSRAAASCSPTSRASSGWRSRRRGPSSPTRRASPGGSPRSLVLVGVPLFLFVTIRPRRWKLRRRHRVALAIMYVIAGLLGTSDFLNSNLSRLPERRRRAGDLRHAGARRHHRGHRVPARDRDRGLPRGVRARQPPHPARAAEHPQPRRRAVGRVRPARPGACSSSSWAPTSTTSP